MLAEGGVWTGVRKEGLQLACQSEHYEVERLYPVAPSSLLWHRCLPQLWRRDDDDGQAEAARELTGQ